MQTFYNQSNKKLKQVAKPQNEDDTVRAPFNVFLYMYNNQIANPSQSMHKEFPSKSMTQSYLKNPTYPPNSPPANHSYYYSRPNTNYISFSPDRMNHSFIGPSSSIHAQQFRSDQYPPKQIDTMKSCTQLQQKENARIHINKQEAACTPLKSIEQRMIDVQRRIQKIEKQDKKEEKITKHIEEIMHLQLRDIKVNEQLEERMNILEQMMRHIKATKLDRKQFENGQYSNSQTMEAQIQQLWRQQQATKADVKENKERLHRLVSKIQSSVISIGEKYEEFIESNIIKSIEHVNKLTHHYHEEIQSFKNDYMKLKDKLEAFIIEKQSQEPIKESPPLLKMMELSIPNIKIVQSVTIINQKKTEYSGFSNKQIGKEIRNTSGMASYKNNLLNSLYDSIEKAAQKSTQSSSNELLMEKVIYKLDRQYYLLDEYDHYLLDAMNNRVRLTNEHIKILEENGLIS